MMIEISTVEQERNFVVYTNARNEVRSRMATTYVVCRETLFAYDALTARLTQGGDMTDYTSYHAASTASVQPYIEQLQDAMTTIITIMEGIEQAAPDTFGISIPPLPE